MNAIKTFVLSLIILQITNVQAQVGIGTEQPHESAIVDVSSSNRGFLPPRMTYGQIVNKIDGPAEGLIVYCYNCCEAKGSMLLKVDTGWQNLIASCNLDTDGDGIKDVDDIDKDNDGIADVRECHTTNGIGVNIIDDANNDFNVSFTNPLTSNDYTANEFAELLFELGTDAAIVSATFNTGFKKQQLGVFNDLDKITYSSGPNSGNSISDFSTGLLFSSGNASALNGNSSNSGNVSQTTSGPSNISIFNDGSNTSNDVIYLEVVINVPIATQVSGKYFFGSEEYNQFVGGNYKDAAKIYVNGTNYAIGSDGSDISINTINNGQNSAQYQDNDQATKIFNFEPNGLTVEMEYSAPLNAGNNTIIIGIADVGDSSYDSWFFFKGNSFAIPKPVCTDDTDNDGVPNVLDLDSDNDGIPDSHEANGTFVPLSGIDINQNGLDDAYENIGIDSSGVQVVNTDNTDYPDFLDLDSDNNSQSDQSEAGINLSGNDTDFDGLDNAVDTVIGYK